MNKRGEIESGIWAKVFEGTIPFLFIVAACVLIWMAASERSAQTTFQATELANSLDVVASFDGQIKLVNNMIVDDFAIQFTDDSVAVYVNKSNALESKRERKLHVPAAVSVKKLYQLDGQTLPLGLSQVQMSKTEGVLTLAGSATYNRNLGRDQLKFGSYDCKPLAARPSTTGIFIDSLDGFSDASDLRSRISNRQQDAASALITISMINRRTTTAPNSILIYAANDDVARKFACELANSFAVGQITANSATQFNVVVVPVEYNPYLSIQKPFVIISTVLQDTALSSELEKYPTLARKIEEAYLNI